MPTLRELETLCQKPDWRVTGSWLARRFARPVALVGTWAIIRLPIPANLVTAVTLGVGWCAAALLGTGGERGLMWGAAALVLWYVLDHVDGQVARYHRSESVTGIYFDFMMHHLVHPACVFGLAYGMAARTGHLPWTVGGGAFALGLMAQSLSNDCRYKAFFLMLQRRRVGGAGPDRRAAGCHNAVKTEGVLLHAAPACGPAGHPPGSGGAARFLRALVPILCEIPSVVLAVAGLALAAGLNPDGGLRAAEVYVLSMSLLAPAWGIARLSRQVWRQIPDAEFRDLVGSLEALSCPSPAPQTADPSSPTAPEPVRLRSRAIIQARGEGPPSGGGGSGEMACQHRNPYLY